MTHASRTPRPHSIPLRVALALGLVATMASHSAAEGPATDAGDDDALSIVSSDGRTFPAGTGDTGGSPSFAGTGVLPEGQRRPWSAPPEGLRPMEAGFGRSVLGTDQRTMVADTTVFPYRAIAYLAIDFPDSTGWLCTGFFIDANTIATAGHCVYSISEGGWATAITAYPGRNGAQVPYGSASATAFYAVKAWRDHEDHRFDFGAFDIDADLGTTTGWFGYAAGSDTDLAGFKAKIYGYPSDKGGTTMWGMQRKLKGTGARKVFYSIDTFGGQSGSPVFGPLSPDCKPCAIGIHAYGKGIQPFPSSNSGTRIIQDVLDKLTTWSAP